MCCCCCLFYSNLILFQFWWRCWFGWKFSIETTTLRRALRRKLRKEEKCYTWFNEIIFVKWILDFDMHPHTCTLDMGSIFPFAHPYSELWHGTRSIRCNMENYSAETILWEKIEWHNKLNEKFFQEEIKMCILIWCRVLVRACNARMIEQCHKRTANGGDVWNVSHMFSKTFEDRAREWERKNKSRMRCAVSCTLESNDSAKSLNYNRGNAINKTQFVESKIPIRCRTISKWHRRCVYACVKSHFWFCFDFYIIIWMCVYCARWSLSYDERTNISYNTFTPTTHNKHLENKPIEKITDVKH